MKLLLSCNVFKSSFFWSFFFMCFHGWNTLAGSAIQLHSDSALDLIDFHVSQCVNWGWVTFTFEPVWYHCPVPGNGYQYSAVPIFRASYFYWKTFVGASKRSEFWTHPWCQLTHRPAPFLVQQVTANPQQFCFCQVLGQWCINSAKRRSGGTESCAQKPPKKSLWLTK